MNRGHKAPIGFRLLVSAFVAFLFYKGVIRREVLRPGVGFESPVATLFMACLVYSALLFAAWFGCNPFLEVKELGKDLWFQLRNPGRLETLFGSTPKEHQQDKRESLPARKSGSSRQV